MNIACPNPETLRSYLSGRATELETEIFEAHLVGCMRCQADLEILSENFEIKRGWIAYENENFVFVIPTDGDLESLVDLRLPHQHKLDLDRIGVSHVLSMLFNADIKPRNSISRLRQQFAGAFSDLSRGKEFRPNS